MRVAAKRTSIGLNLMRDKASTLLLFVYGTLKRGGCRHGPLAGQHFRGEAHTRPGYALYDLGDYPGMTRALPAGQVVHGEMYEVEETLLSWLDTVEGAPDWFKREPVEVEGFSEVVWAYLYQGDPADRPRIASGRWENDRTAGDKS
jgi:gamma-glutamylaminecyclotransferase